MTDLHGPIPASPPFLRRLRKHRSGLFGGTLCLAVCATAAFGSWLAPFDPLAQQFPVLTPPALSSHVFGTDDLGRDAFSRVMVAARASVTIAFVAVLLAGSFGVLIGVASGYFGGWTDLILMRSMDVLMALPSFLLAILIVAVLGQGMFEVVLAVATVAVPTFARQIRSSVLQLVEQDFVIAAHALGASPWRILYKTVLPNCLGQILVLASVAMGVSILDAAGLFFLGLGGEPDVPEWGYMLNETRGYFRVAPWTVVFPGLALSVTVLGFNLFGDALRDLLDPRTRGESE